MKKKFILLLIILCIAASVGLICAVLLNSSFSEGQQQDVEALRDQLKTYKTVDETELSTEEFSDETVWKESETESETMESETREQVIQPEEIETPAETETDILLVETELTKVPDENLDFISMWGTNPDICAWIEIEGTKVDYPVLQSEDDDEKYLTTAVDGSYYIGGSLFTQATYNSRYFNDPVTIIYGHTMRSGALFGQLQPIYSSSSEFESHSEIKLYLPDEVRYYTVFAAVPYENIHILYTYDFTNNYWYENFFDGVSNIRSIGANFNHNITPKPGDRVIILSTCLNEDSTKRFLVMAINQDDIS